MQLNATAHDYRHPLIAMQENYISRNTGIPVENVRPIAQAGRHAVGRMFKAAGIGAVIAMIASRMLAPLARKNWQAALKKTPLMALLGANIAALAYAVPTQIRELRKFWRQNPQLIAQMRQPYRTIYQKTI